MAIEHELEHVERALARLTQQFRGKTNVEALLSALAAPGQDVEDACWQLLTERTVDEAIGAQLDDLGAIVGEERQSRDDDDYRRFIRARITVNRSTGSANDILTVARLVLDLDFVDATFDLEMQPPAGLVLRILDVITTTELAEIFGVYFLRHTAAAGVRAIFESTPVDPAELLILDSGALDTKKLADASA